MSPWATDSTDSKESVATQEGPTGAEGQPLTRKLPLWLGVVPFFASAFFFLSGIFAIVAPLPLVLVSLRKGRMLGWGALLSNGLLVGLLGGLPSLFIYLLFVGTLGVSIPEFLRLRRSVGFVGACTLGVLALSMAGLVGAVALSKGVSPFVLLQSQVSEAVDYVSKNMPAGTSGLPTNEADLDEWKSAVVEEFPSALAIFGLILVWANLTLLIRFNPVSMRERFGIDPLVLKTWKTPEALVWPTLALGFLALSNFGSMGVWALNGFKFIMAIYAIQGLSVLSALLDTWGPKGWIRGAIYGVVLFVMLPVVLALGFFDLWFDFRSKFRQS